MKRTRNEFGFPPEITLMRRPQSKRGFGLGSQVELTLYINGLSKPHRDYLAAGGQGFFLGDGRLSYATERILETSYYSFSLVKKTALFLGLQHVVHPGYNRDRGPADFLSLRIHAEI